MYETIRFTWHARKRKDKENEANVYIWLGWVHRENNQIQTAIEYYQQALAIDID